MTIFDNTLIQNIVLHQVGNKSKDEGVFLSKKPLELNEELNAILKKYFTQAFNSEEYYHFYHDSDIKFNEVYSFISNIFDNQLTIFDNSVNLAKHLYEKSNHPKIKSGEFYTIYFKDCIILGEETDAIGLFKSENRDTFLKIINEHNDFNIISEEGININKLDKGCIIFNTEKRNGYVVAIVDNTNRGIEAQYWIDDFLHVQQRQDNYYNTNKALSLCKTYVIKELPKQFDVNKVDQVDLLNKSMNFFKENETFEFEKFTNKVIDQPEVIESFNQFKNDFQKEYDISIKDSFTINEKAVSKQSKVFKSIIKLDKNFHIYVHGNRDLISQGKDEKGKFYKVYYKEEF